MMRFVRWMMVLLAGFFVMSVVRIVMQGFMKGMTGSSKETAAASKPDVSPGGELKKCAACGVYNANSVTKVRDGVTLYYCSTECRSKAASAA